MRGHALTLLACSSLAACAPIAPVQVDTAGAAWAFRARSLADPVLVEAARKRGDATAWPPARLTRRDLDLIAITEAPALPTALARWDAARAAVRTAGAIPNPTLSLNPAYISGGGGGPPLFLATTLIQLIETANKRPLRIAKTEYRAEAARLQVASTAWMVIAEVRGAAIDVSAARDRLAALDQQIAIQRDLADTAAKRLAVGLGSSVELTVARTALTRAVIDRAATAAAEVEAQNRLARALGLPVAALSGAPLDFGLEAPSLSEQFLATAAARAPLRRADVLAGIADYSASIVEFRLQNATRIPNVELGPSVEYDQGTNKWGLSVAVAPPIFNRNAGPIAEASAQERVAASQLLETQATAIGEADRAVAAYRQALAGVVVADRLVVDQQKQVLAQQRLLATGETGRADLLTGRANLAVARLGLVDARTALARARLAVEVAAQAMSDGSDPLTLITGWTAHDTSPATQ